MTKSEHSILGSKPARDYNDSPLNGGDAVEDAVVVEDKAEDSAPVYKDYIASRIKQAAYELQNALTMLPVPEAQNALHHVQTGLLWAEAAMKKVDDEAIAANERDDA